MGMRHDVECYVPRFVHVGEDVCFRVAVLRGAGFQVDVCISAVQLRDVLLYRGETDAILIPDHDGEISEEILHLIRGCSSAPVVLFRSSNRDYPKAWFDLVIPVLSRPAEWLRDIAEVTESTESASFQTGAVRRNLSLV